MSINTVILFEVRLAHFCILQRVCFLLFGRNMVQGIKKKRVSKKSKLSWRKHVSIADIEEFLEDKRLEERLG